MRITLKDVAREAGASVAAVSATLNGKRVSNMRIGEATRERIIETAARLGYVPNPVAQSLSTGRTGVLGLVFPYVDAFIDRNPFCTMLMNGILAEVIADQYNLMLYTGRDAQWAGRGRVDPRVDGLIVALPTPNDPLLVRCGESDFPCVCVVTVPQPEPIMTVNADDYRGGYLATQHLVALGHKRIMILHGGDAVSTNQPRLRGYRDVLSDASIPIIDSMIVEAGFDWKPAAEAMSVVLDRPKSEWPTAIFAINDLCALGAMQTIKDRGLRVPDDIAIVGFDDTWLSTTTDPTLTTVRMPIREMGALAARMLANQIEGKPDPNRNPILEVTLTIRQSCGSPLGVLQPTYSHS